jgi:ABC-2 type transport system ATP-binding protein
LTVNPNKVGLFYFYMSEILFEAQSISKKYGDFVALNNINISVPKGSIFGLLGPNGAGKTTFIRIINQITLPDTGFLLFNGKEFLPNDIEKIGYLPEERGLYKKMQVGEQCLYLAQLRGLERQEAKKRLRFWFEKFGIQGWWNKKVEELSKGMAQKIQFVVTVIHEPELLILDEPFTGFDPVNASLIRDEIIELRNKGATIIFSTHRMETVEDLCDSIALINKSNKILDGTVAEIRKQNRTNIFRIEFIGNLVNFTNAIWAGAELLDKKQVGEHCTVTLKILGQNTPNSLISSVLPTCQILSFNEIVPTMSDIFIKTVQAD